MALHDFWCDRCLTVLTDVNVPIEIGAKKGAPEHCGQKATWIPQVGRMDAYEPFQAFNAFDGRNQPVVVDSLSKMRKLERQSEQDYRNGEGQPMVWRRWSQDNSNRDVNTMGEIEQERPTAEAMRRFKPGAVKGDPNDIAYGPGVSDANTTALKDR